MAFRSRCRRQNSAAVATASAPDRLASIAVRSSHGHQAMPTVVFDPDMAQATAYTVSGHNTYVLLEDLKPGQRVLLDVTSILDEPFAIEPQLDNLHGYLRDFSSEQQTSKDALYVMYNTLHKEVRTFNPQQVYSMAVRNPAHTMTWCLFVSYCEMLAVLRQLCFDEPIPLIDMDSSMVQQKDNSDATSSTKARQISTPVMSDTNATDRKDKGPSSSSYKNKQLGVRAGFSVPCVFEGQRKTFYACFPHDLHRPGRLLMELKPILNVEGWLVTSRAFLLQNVDCVKWRMQHSWTAVQQEYRDVYQNCVIFVKEQLIHRSDEEWRQFITNCVRLYALRNVLHDQALPMCSMDGDDAMDELLQAVEAAKPYRHGLSNDLHSGDALGFFRWTRGVDTITFNEVEKLKAIEVFCGDCVGVPYLMTAKGTTVANLRKRAERLCLQDPAAAKLYCGELTRSCKKTAVEVTKLEDMAKIGIPQAVEEMKCWSTNCLYWCVLRKVLYNEPMMVQLGRYGSPVDSGLRTPCGKVYALHT